jgi:Transposase DDE domain/Domain of unknown function (DUF4372)
MHCENTVFHKLLKLVPWPVFKELVKKYGMDERVRGLPTKAQFIAMLFAQLAGSASLRDLVTTLESHPAMLYPVGGKPVRRSTLADANRDRSHAFFDELFAAVLANGEVGLPRKMRQAVRLIDSTSVKLSSLSSAWARFSNGVFGAKLHVVYALDEERPVYFAVTPANVNDITPAKSIEIEAQATYVFDLGYYDFAWWAALDAQGARIVTRFKSNTPLNVVAEMKVLKNQDLILSDRIGHLPDRLAYSRKNPMQDPVREVRIRIETGKTLRLLTNDLDAPAQDIADLYKSRWQIELFFRWIKQMLKIKRFLGTSENAVRIQVAVALIAFLLLRIAQAFYKVAQSPLTFARLIRATLTHRRAITRVLAPPGPPQSKAQMIMDFAPC